MSIDELEYLRVRVAELYSQVDQLYDQTEALSTLVRILVDYQGFSPNGLAQQMIDRLLSVLPPPKIK